MNFVLGRSLDLRFPPLSFGLYMGIEAPCNIQFLTPYWGITVCVLCRKQYLRKLEYTVDEGLKDFLKPSWLAQSALTLVIFVLRESTRLRGCYFRSCGLIFYLAVINKLPAMI